MSESHINPYVWDQLELVRMLIDLYIKDNDLRNGQSDGVLATPQRLKLKEEINIQTSLLVNKSNQCTNGILEKDEFGNPTKTQFEMKG